MRCEEARPLISAGLDGELDGICAAQLRTHLAECVVCSTERETLVATVRLLRDLPETQPPAALRRRIGVALLEIERGAQRRRAALGWRVRPHAPGWAWGAAVGIAAAGVILLATRGHAPAPRVARLPNPVPAAVPAPPTPVPSQTSTRRERKPAEAVPPKPAAIKPRTTLPALTADLPPVEMPTPRLLPSDPAAVLTQPTHRHGTHARMMRRSRPAAHFPGPAPDPPQGSTHVAPSPATAGPDWPAGTHDDATRVAHSDPTASTDTSTLPFSDPEARSDTTGMTQMASGGAMPTPPESEEDDLTELRRRLIDRPLQVPELGQLKPAAPARASRDGWIRF